MLTIVISEKQQRQQDLGSQRQPQTAAPAWQLGVDPAGCSAACCAARTPKLGRQQRFNGKGGANASNTFTGTITVTVIEVLRQRQPDGERREADRASTRARSSSASPAW